MSFKDRSFDDRFKDMGDEAEGHFEEYAAKKLKKGVVRYGLNRPPIRMSDLPTRLRYTPDYLMGKHFVEVQGFGKDQTFKLKHEKLNSLHYWNDLHPVYLYVWDSTNERECMLHLFELDKLIDQGKTTLAAFPEGKAYFAFAAQDIFDAASS